MAILEKVDEPATPELVAMSFYVSSALPTRPRASLPAIRPELACV